jgi:hypothetical protein
MDQEFYRQVPYRFFNNDINTDACKLEKLTNLFPDMKATIELGKYLFIHIIKSFFFFTELFKINNFSRTIDRLSRIYTVLTALDTRDDTLHLFLGPYHLSLGPAVFAALHIKSASAALLVAARPPITDGTGTHRRKRRREAVLRRFRRAVRKLTLVKSIVDQLRPASVLTPYNQYELQTHGIYDLVLAGRAPDANLLFTNDNFLEQLHNIDSIECSGERSPLLASNFFKINNLLNLLSSSQQQPTQPLEASIATSKGTMMRFKSNESLVNATNNNDPGGLINSTAMCCSYHQNSSPYLMFPVNRPLSPQPSQFLTTGFRSRQNSTSNLLRTPPVLSRQSTVCYRHKQIYIYVKNIKLCRANI